MSRMKFMLIMLLCMPLFLNSAHSINENNISFGFGASVGTIEQIRLRTSEKAGSIGAAESLKGEFPYYLECSYGRSLSDIARIGVDVIFSNIPIQKIASLEPILQCYGIMAATKLFIPSSMRVVPYLNIGIGYGWYSSKTSDDLFSEEMEIYLMREYKNVRYNLFNDIERNGLLWKLGAGTEYRLNSNLSLFLQTEVLRQPSLTPAGSFGNKAAIRWRGVLFGGVSMNF
ncbi:hypothetical protein [Candidatus Fokinia solitaria]|nr:hypothetical protein [Candidatus Fokinia solitaria]